MPGKYNAMPDYLSRPCTAFHGAHRLAQGALVDVALAIRDAPSSDPNGQILVFDDATGSVIDLDLRGSTAEIVGRLNQRAKDRAPSGEKEPSSANRGRGRPRLGVVAREVTLLPRHWEWLAGQRGGASQALRRLVDEARRVDGGRTEHRANQERAYRFMSAMAGNLAGYEEALRALFAGDRERFDGHTTSWPADIRAYAKELAWKRTT